MVFSFASLKYLSPFPSNHQLQVPIIINYISGNEYYNEMAINVRTRICKREQFSYQSQLFYEGSTDTLKHWSVYLNTWCDISLLIRSCFYLNISYDLSFLTNHRLAFKSTRVMIPFASQSQHGFQKSPCAQRFYAPVAGFPLETYSCQKMAPIYLCHGIQSGWNR